MDQEKRKGEAPIPEHVKDYLNDEQLRELHKIEGFGWRLHFIRRQLFQDPVVVVINPEGDAIGVLEEDGRINLQPDIPLRSE